jgi:glycosyltransferase involved in cell wall biosynthesis
MAEATVSAVIPVRDGERYLAEAIESALAQTHPCQEVIVVDNGSADRSAEIARSFGPPVRVCPEPRRGIGPARNAGLAAATGDYIGYLDHDDTWDPRKNEVQLEAFLGEPPPDIVFGHVRQFVSPGLDPELAARLRLPEQAQPGLHLGAMLAPRGVWELVGPWEDDWELADGLAWFVRARDLGLREAMIPEVVGYRRIHGANQSIARREVRGAEYARLLKASLDRRRARGR